MRRPAAGTLAPVSPPKGQRPRVGRAEDVAACAILGATPDAGCPFGSVDYERHGDEIAVRDAISAAAEGVDALLLPGFPLSHPDHEWLGRALVGAPHGLPPPRALRGAAVRPEDGGASLAVPAWAEEALGARPVFGGVSAGARDRLAKWRAVREYRTQLPLLGMTRSLRRGPHSLVFGERVAWIEP